jgi:hypothetical protein
MMQDPFRSMHASAPHTQEREEAYNRHHLGGSPTSLTRPEPLPTTNPSHAKCG